MRVNIDLEKKLWEKGYKRVVGLDEAGRGALAGPVVAAGVVIDRPPTSAKLADVGGRSALKNSKKLTPKKREKLYQILTNHPAIRWQVSEISARVIDKINILEATKLAMKRVVEKLGFGPISGKPDFLIIDGNFKIDLKIPQKSIVKADEKVFSCIAASIIAKVTRDSIMKKNHQKYPQYGFDRHKGYPTKFHKKMLKKYGSSKIHRKSFRW